MKKILFIISVLLISQTFAVESQNDFQTINRLKYGQDYIAVGTISATHEENVNFKPDTAEFSITYLTEGATPNNASNRNIKNMDELKKYLKTLGVKESDISTAQYRNYQRDVKEPLGDNLFVTKLTATIKTSEDNIYNVIQLLEKNGISNLKKDDYSSHAELYHFTVETQAKSENEAKKNAKDIFEKISKTLKNSGIAYIDIREYETKQTLENTRNVKKYFVSNTINIKTSNFDNVGKIFTKAQELKMTINNDLYYSVSDEQREKVTKEIEGKLFEKLQEKAQRLITKKGFSLGAPSNIHIQNPYIRYDDDYYESRNTMSNYAQTDQVQAANEVSIDPPSEYKTKFIISGNFDILQEVKR